MGLTKPPKAFLKDSFSYFEYQDTDKWSKPIYSEPLLVNNCRIDNETVFSYSTAGKQLLFNALIFCYEGITTPLPVFKEQSKVVFGNVEHIIVRVIPVYEAFENNIYSYEIEVI